MTAAMAERSALGEKNDSGNGLVDPQLWHACAGSQVQVPQVGSSVIYFPQGHAEHAASPPEFPLGFSSSTIACRVLSVKFLADRETDEVYARIALHPENSTPKPSSMFDPPSPPQSLNPTKIASFAKTLTQSDANNGGGFSVPRYCAETIFPRLDYSEDPPVQIVLAKDVHGNVWKFRHIYRGTPRRHLLTTGWSNFVNQKKLVAGDAIVFLRSGSGELCVGVRRSTKGMGGMDLATPWHQLSSVGASSAARSLSWDVQSIEKTYNFLDNCAGSSPLIRSKLDFPLPTSSFARNRARVTAKSVLEAATLASSGQAFEVVFYPRTTIAEFCVRAHSVRMSLQQNWAPGMRFKMAVETEDASRISWFMGTVSKVQEADPVLWPNSPWKMLQVTWDEPDLLQGITRVSPWQVELVSPMQLPPFAFPKKKVRLSQPADLLDGQEYMGLSTGAVTNEMPGYMNPWHGYFENVPAGMQGARHEGNYGLSFQAPKFHSTGLLLNNIYQQQEYPLMGDVVPRAANEVNVRDFFRQGYAEVQSSPSTVLTVGNSNGNNSLSQLSSSGIASYNGGAASGRRKASFLLFGKTIDTSQPINPQQPQVSSDSSRHEAISDGFKSEVCDDSHRLITDQGSVLHPLMSSSMVFQQQDAMTSACGLGSLKWSNDQASYLDRSVLDSGSQHCKVFSESDDIGRTVDLSSFGSYQQLYEALENMFGAQKSDFLNRVVCVDSMGFSRPIGDEPYWDFMNRVKRLKILTESSSENMTK
uniref:Auxin response factor n=1 Tax=Cyrtomium guizhouense TaxID=306076 RepID=A0A1X9T673_9MONI|nr:auxin response factor 10 [Cyrtomium guizhouense]